MNLNYLESIKNIFSVIEKKIKHKIIYLIIFSIISSISEIFSIAIIIPFVQVILMSKEELKTLLFLKILIC